MTPQDYAPKTRMMDHQRDVFLKTADKPYWGYFLEPGLGKSKILIDNAAYLYLRQEIEALVISTVKAMCPTFEFIEIPKHMPDTVDYCVFRYDASKRSSKKFKQDWANFKKFKGLKILIINVEAAATKPATEMMRELYKVVNNRYMMGIDESTTIKTHTTKRSKAVVSFSRAAKYKRVLTGTPITNGPLEVYGQALALGKPEDLLGHKSFYSFRGYYAEMERKTFGNRSFQVVTGYRNKDELTKTISEWSSIIKKTDALDLPEKIYSKVLVEMPKDQANMYQKLRDEAILELDAMGEEIEVTNILTLLVKLHQVVCGQIKYEDDAGRERYASIENNRIATLLDLIELETGNVVVWANYRQSLKDIIKAVEEKHGKESVISYFGSVKARDKEEAVARFQDPDDPARFFIGNPQSAGWGLTLTAADLAIYYSNSYSLEHRIQSEDRIHRIGQVNAARYIDLYTKGTVDEKIIASLHAKKKLADDVIVSNWRSLF